MQGMNSGKMIRAQKENVRLGKVGTYDDIHLWAMHHHYSSITSRPMS